jgi:hypothetical protein
MYSSSKAGLPFHSHSPKTWRTEGRLRELPISYSRWSRARIAEVGTAAVGHFTAAELLPEELHLSMINLLPV